MSSLGSPSTLFLAKKEAYEVDRSLRFDDSSSSDLSRTPSSTGNRKVWTFSAWIKLGHVDSGPNYIYSAHSGSDYFGLYFQSNQLYTYFSPSNNYGSVSDRKLRDVGAWFHLVHQVDAENTTQRIWINNEEMTLDSNRNPSNSNFPMNQSGVAMKVGNATWRDDNVDSYMAEIHYSDGYKYTPTDFAETNAITGQWVPKSPSISYGTNGFYLNFSDNSGTTATTLGKDSSGNGNNFTPNNFSVSSGTGNDSVTDTPTNNFCTLNSLDKAGNATFSNGALKLASMGGGNNYDGFRASFGSKTGKYYWEVKFPNVGYITGIGIARTDGRIDNGNQPTYRITLGMGSWFTSYNSNNVNTYVNANPSSDYGNWSGASNYSANDVYMIAVDFGAGKIWWGKNGSWFNNSGTANPATGTDPRITFTTGNEWFPYSVEGSSSSSLQEYNFGQQGFAYTPPTGFVALNSANLPDPTIKLPDKHFDTFLYSATGNAMSFSGLNFQPDWIWQKRRDSTGGSHFHYLFDAVRGGTQGLQSNTNGAEFTASAPNITFTSNGYDMVASSGGQGNASGGTYVSWNWDAGETDGKTYTVKVVSDSGNKYRFDDFGTSAVTLDLAEGGTYIFDQSDSSNSGHPLRFSTTSNGTHGGGSEYTTGVTTAGTPGQSGAYTQIVVAASAPTLYYYCSVHSGMGGQANTNSTLGSSNFDGSIQSTAKVNATAGFSIITWTGTGSAGTIGHGLGVAPKWLVVKLRSGSQDWFVNNGMILNDYGKYFKLSTTGAAASDTNVFPNTAPTSTVFSVGTDSAVNSSSSTYVAYVFSEVAGYSKFGSYAGNGNNDGTFVFIGFRPAWVMVKRYDGTGQGWNIFDNKRNTFNLVDEFLIANSSNAEATGSALNLDFLSNGFKFRGTDGGSNTSGSDYIYLAFAESPFKNARAR